MTRLALALLLLAAPASAATWTSTLPTTGSPCVEWRWQNVEPSGVVLFEVLTDSNWATHPDVSAPVRERCCCRDDSLRWSPWSEWSAPYFAPQLVAQYQRAGVLLRLPPLSMTIALVRGVEWVEPNEGE